MFTTLILLPAQREDFIGYGYDAAPPANG